MQLPFVLAKDYQGGGNSPTGSQWSFSSVDLEFRLFNLRQKNFERYVFRMCFNLAHVFGHRYACCENENITKY